MKFLCNLILLLFILFLSTPTIVSVIDSGADTSNFFNSSEEESHCQFSEIKSITISYSIPLVIDIEGLQKVQCSILNDRKVNSLKPKIFIPPPEFI
jgi:hypothetical protein